MVYKHAISTIVPARAVNITTGDEKEEENQSAE
jgi:host factor-I protein